jgi:tripartite-type tricarboxylate transporter receptor subunit TctC
MKRIAALLLAVPLAAASLAAQAQAWPARPVKFVVPFGAGGPADIYARFLGQRLQEPLGQSFVVEDRPGGGSVVGSDYVAKSAPDGYTFLVMSNTHTVNETLIPKKPFQLMRDFVPVTPINYSDLLLVVHPSVPANNLAELIALAKRQPGKMNYASSGPGTPYHMAGELFKSMAGIDVVHVPYKGSDGARVGILGGQVQMMFDAITTMAPNVRAGKLKGFGTSGRARSSVLPDVPTVAEAGVPGYEATIWLGIVAPAGTPAPIVERLNAEVRKIAASAEVKEAWGKQGATPLVMTPAEFTQYLHGDIAKWAKVIAQAGIKLD